MKHDLPQVIALFLLLAFSIYAGQAAVKQAHQPLIGASPASQAPTVASQKTDWKVGDYVQAKWSGNQKLYPAVIIEVKGDSYKVRFDDDNSEEWVGQSNIRPLQPPQPAKEWTWKDGTGQTRSAADFQAILQQHRQWLDSGGKAGAQANFTKANLQDVQLTGANLSKAILDGADLSSSSFLKKVTDLDMANLSEASMVNVKMGHVSAEFVNLTKADLSNALIDNSNLSQGILFEANLTGAVFTNSDLTRGLLSTAKLTKTKFISGKLNDLLFSRADLSNAVFMDEVDLSDANFKLANLRGTRFEPAKNPNIRNIADAYNLERLTYLHSPAALAQLRNAFKENGLNEQRKKITYAMKRTENDLLRKAALDFKCEEPDCERENQEGRNCQNGVCPGEWMNYLYYYLNLIFFDWTVRYGMKPERALIIMLYLWFICSLIYVLFIHFPRTSGIFLIKHRHEKYSIHRQGMRILPHYVAQTKGWKGWWQRLRSEWRVLRIGMFFSLKSAFNIGFREVNVGHWLSLLTKREYDLKPKHWTRTVSGFQSLLSLYLIAMWVLTHFGHPFE